MEPTFWQHRWAEDRTGWHQPEANRMLVRHWPALKLPPDSRVFVPLCGKSLDMAWLADQGHQVFGVELAPDACEAFFAERGLTPAVENKGAFRRYRAGAIELWAGNAFDLTAADLSDCTACYDRPALIALPPDLRRRYVDNVLGLLPRGCRTLLITLEYPGTEMHGPPFSVEEAEVHHLFEPQWRVSFQERRNILAREASFQEQGVTRLHAAAYRLRSDRPPHSIDA